MARNGKGIAVLRKVCVCVCTCLRVCLYVKSGQTSCPAHLCRWQGSRGPGGCLVYYIVTFNSVSEGDSPQGIRVEGSGWWLKANGQEEIVHNLFSSVHCNYK